VEEEVPAETEAADISVEEATEEEVEARVLTAAKVLPVIAEKAEKEIQGAGNSTFSPEN
jgi:hypothetical protein